jgi:predicted transcriptional regulator
MSDIDLTILRNNLKKARHLQDISAKELSIKAGLRQQKRIADIEEGRGKPTLEEIHTICQVLKQPIDFMLYHEATMKLDFLSNIKFV